MLVCAMDMGDLAVAAGGYPDGYIAVADEQGYLQSINAQKGELLSRGTVAMILYNVLMF